MSIQKEKRSGDSLATWSMILGIGGVGFSIVLVGVPFCIAAVVLAIKALKTGDFSTYDSYDDDFSGSPTERSYSFRAYLGLIFGGIGCLIGLGICAMVL